MDKLEKPDPFREALVRLGGYVSFRERKTFFWKGLLSTLAGVVEARYPVLLRGTGEQDDGGWLQVVAWPKDRLPDQFARRWRCAERGE